MIVRGDHPGLERLVSQATSANELQAIGAWSRLGAWVAAEKGGYETGQKVLASLMSPEGFAEAVRTQQVRRRRRRRKRRRHEGLFHDGMRDSLVGLLTMPFSPPCRPLQSQHSAMIVRAYPTCMLSSHHPKSLLIPVPTSISPIAWHRPHQVGRARPLVDEYC